MGRLEKLVRPVTKRCLADLRAGKGFGGRVSHWWPKAEAEKESGGPQRLWLSPVRWVLRPLPSPHHPVSAKNTHSKTVRTAENRTILALGELAVINVSGQRPGEEMRAMRHNLEEAL